MFHPMLSLARNPFAFMAEMQRQMMPESFFRVARDRPSRFQQQPQAREQQQPLAAQQQALTQNSKTNQQQLTTTQAAENQQVAAQPRESNRQLARQHRDRDLWASPFFRDPFFNSFGDMAPFRQMQRMMDQAQREMDELIPALDVNETDKLYSINVEIPGVKKGDIKITLAGEDNRRLTIVAERKEELMLDADESSPAAEAKDSAESTTLKADSTTPDAKDATATAAEQQKPTSYTHSRFVRSFDLPDDADVEQISAKHEDGILKLSVPKIAQAPPKPQRQISIN